MHDGRNYQTNFYCQQLNNQRVHTSTNEKDQININRNTYMTSRTHNMKQFPIDPYSSQNILHSPFKQEYNPNYSNQRFSNPSYLVTSPSFYKPSYSTTSNPTSLETIKNYFVKTLLNKQDRPDTSRVQHIPLVINNRYIYSIDTR